MGRNNGYDREDQGAYEREHERTPQDRPNGKSNGHDGSKTIVRAHALRHGDPAEEQRSGAKVEASVEADRWPQVVDRWKLTPCEGRALRDIYAGEKFEAIGRKYGGTAHAIDKHWREIQRKMGIKGRVLVTRAIADFLADLRQQAAVAEAVTPREATIAECNETIAGLLQRVNELEERNAKRKAK